jgi:hypothetical protein
MAAQLTALGRLESKTTPLTLLVFRAEGFAAAGPFESGPEWRAAVREAMAVADDVVPPPGRLYAAIMASAAALGRNWSAAILAGPIPEPDADTRDYARARLSSSFCAQKVRVSYWSPAGDPPTFWTAVAGETGGAAAAGALTDLAGAPGNGPWNEAAWPAEPPSRGFVVDRAKLASQTPGAPATEVPVLTAGPGTVLPTLEQYAEFAALDRQMAALARAEKPDAAQVDLLAYRPLETKDDEWRQIQVSLAGSRDYRDRTVRSKQGYYPR